MGNARYPKALHRRHSFKSSPEVSPLPVFKVNPESFVEMVWTHYRTKVPLPQGGIFQLRRARCRNPSGRAWPAAMPGWGLRRCLVCERYPAFGPPLASGVRPFFARRKGSRPAARAAGNRPPFGRQACAPAPLPAALRCRSRNSAGSGCRRIASALSCFSMQEYPQPARAPRACGRACRLGRTARRDRKAPSRARRAAFARARGRRAADGRRNATKGGPWRRSE